PGCGHGHVAFRGADGCARDLCGSGVRRCWGSSVTHSWVDDRGSWAVGYDHAECNQPAVGGHFVEYSHVDGHRDDDGPVDDLRAQCPARAVISTRLGNLLN